MLAQTDRIQKHKEDITIALKDYFERALIQDIYNDVTDEFITQLAHDSTIAKQELRTLFKKHPAYDENLDAIVLSSKTTHKKDEKRIGYLCRHLLKKEVDNNAITDEDVVYIGSFLSKNEQEPNEQEHTTITKIIGDKFRPDRKKSRTFLQIAKELNVYEEKTGSDFQKTFAQLADEITSKQINFKLYLSLNPAHMLTMSNPSTCTDEEMLITCQSFDRETYAHVTACSGYARDDVTFIAFTVTDDEDPSTFHNRKLTRQLFSYQPCNGVLLQNRLYSTFNQTDKHDDLNKLYRHLVQQTIADLENVPNLWITKPGDAHIDEHENNLYAQPKRIFNGYCDWLYNPKSAKISILKAKMDHAEPITVGESGICIICAKEQNRGHYCYECHDKIFDVCCECAEEFRKKDLYILSDNSPVCHACYNEIPMCHHCGKLLLSSQCFSTGDNDFCQNCFYDQNNE